MNRLTKKNSNWYQVYDEERNEEGYYEKLYVLEDIEEELGIDLITLFKALENGIYFKDKTQKVLYAKASLLSNYDNESELNFWCKEECKQEEIKVTGFSLLEQIFGNVYELKDYGKTWALTKEELE